jgi:hypothetical protein
MSFISGIAAKIKGHDCKRFVKQLASELSISGPEIDAAGMGVAKINIGLFSRRLVELVKAKECLSLKEST